MSALAPGQLISDRYLLDRRIAVGGMGEVWEASDTRLGRSVAVKVLKSDLSDDPEFLHRFRIEARTVASLDHTGIAAVHDYGEDDGPAGGGRTAYLVMELVRGEPLSTRIARGPIPMHEALDIVEQAARALQAAHERGFVHRDVKPGNILLRTDGVVKLTDFGIAKAADAVPVTRSGMVMGTAHYIAPEQASGEEAGPAGDVYSLGIVGYECLAGHRPFRAESAVAVAMMQVRDDPPPLPTEIPERVRELISSVLVKDPERRYADGAEFAEAVAAVRRGQRAPAVGADVEEHNAASWTTAAPSATPRRHADDPDPSSGAAPSTPAPNTPAPRTPAPRTPAPRTTRGPRPTGPRSAGLPTHAPTSYDAGPQPRHRSGDVDPRRGGPGGPEGPRHPSGPVPLRSNTPPPGTPHPSWSTGDGRPAGDAPWRPPQRPVRSDGPSATEHPSGPLDFSPRRSGRRRALLAALFVLLTIAAVLLAVLILRGTSFAVLTTNSMIYPPGTVSGWKADLTGPAVPAWPPAPLVADGAGEAVR